MCREHTDESRRLRQLGEKHFCRACWDLGKPCPEYDRLVRESEEAMITKEGCR